MWTQESALMLLLACCLWSAEAQSDRRQNIWDDPIKFKTQAKDACTMIITGQGEYTRLKLSCRSSKRSYWCEYVGKPHTCSPYNKNPRHYFVQMMWGLRKLHNACLAQRQIKPHMCRKATDESQMVFSGASFPRSVAEASARMRPAAQPGRPSPTRPRPSPTRPGSARLTVGVPPRMQPTPRASPPPATTPVESNAKRMAQQYCWRSLQGICSYFIGFVRH
ncbi:fibroblast growth factor binding protein 2a [Anarrhichthys ocellatus]|uniref:fibroblast growth factor binding protein 2a n=1 Tax=Anarrhichthys ocellatus TaxID=433405 RepID=UPI0012ED0AF1|nr:fibroblast growth factor-binding protein 2-like [Anarrhichthys ocellatus]